MDVFIAGGSGAIGLPLARALAAAGHRVIALTRSGARQDDIRATGASVAIADALDPDALAAAVAAARPTHVVHLLTALPKDGPRRASDLAETNRLRVDGTRHLLAAAIAVGARRFIVGSFAPLSPRDGVAVEPRDEAAAAVRSMECQVIGAARQGLIEGSVLRYGMIYGPGTSSTVSMLAMVRKRRLPVIRGDAGKLSLVHIDDVVSATMRALEVAPAGSTYDIVDDCAVSISDLIMTVAELTRAPTPFTVPSWLPRLVAPYAASMTSKRLVLSNQPARAELGWHPKYSTMREGFADMFREAV